MQHAFTAKGNMAKRKSDVVIRVTSGEFLTISNAIEVCRSVAGLDDIHTFSEFEARMDRTIELAKRVKTALDGRSVHFAADGDA